MRNSSWLVGIFLFLAVVSGVPVAVADSGYSVRSLLMLCIETIDDESWREVLAPSCENYIKGWLDAMGYFAATPAWVCVPDTGFQVPQISREFVRWAVFHPDHYDLPANDGVVATLKEIYSCH